MTATTPAPVEPLAAYRLSRVLGVRLDPPHGPLSLILGLRLDAAAKDIAAALDDDQLCAVIAKLEEGADAARRRRR